MSVPQDVVIKARDHYHREIHDLRHEINHKNNVIRFRDNEIRHLNHRVNEERGHGERVLNDERHRLNCEKEDERRRHGDDIRNRENDMNN